MWDVHCQPGGGWIAYASADGEVAVVRLERDLASQRHSVLAGAYSHTHIPFSCPSSNGKLYIG